MKKIFLILILGLFWCNVGIASEAGGVREPGHDQNVLKNSNLLVQVFVSENYPSDMMENLTKGLGKVEITQVKKNSEEMGTLLRKPFLISVIGIKK